MSAKRHSISRSQDATAENRRPIETEGSDAARQKDRREQDKKSMLSKALQKAHTAVLLDNAQNFEGAIEAYSDACRLLQHVLQRSTGEEDRRKLDAIVSCSVTIVLLTLLNSSAYYIHESHHGITTASCRLASDDRQISPKTTQQCLATYNVHVNNRRCFRGRRRRRRRL